MDKIWKYNPEDEFTNKNAGFSLWCFGEYNGKSYFIKQFLSPKYPFNDKVSTAEKINRRIGACKEFERRKNKLYKAIAEYSDGNDVRIIEFFRFGSRYYMVTEKIDVLPWTVEDVSAQDETDVRRFCAVIAHSIAAIHRGGLVHSDIKHDNILFTKTESSITAKVIDFDGGFFESNPPTLEEGVTGDINYFAPEVCARSFGKETALTCKVDVFALGILFHQYFSGKIPEYDTNSFTCPGESVLGGAPLVLSDSIPDDVRSLINKMVSLNPAERPSASEVFSTLRKSFVSEAPEVREESLTENHFVMPRNNPEITDYLICPDCGAVMVKTDRFCRMCGRSAESSEKKAESFFSPLGDIR